MGRHWSISANAYESALQRRNVFLLQPFMTAINKHAAAVPGQQWLEVTFEFQLSLRLPRCEKQFAFTAV